MSQVLSWKVQDEVSVQLQRSEMRSEPERGAQLREMGLWG